MSWVLLLWQIPTEPSRYRVAVWRQLRRSGAVPLAPGVWVLPAGPAFQPDVDRAAELCRNAGGTFAVIDASPRDEASAAMIGDVFRTVRIDEWAEFVADCGKFEREIAHEIQKQKFTFVELEEEEQSLSRLRRWYRDLKKRDVLELADAKTAEEQLRVCTTALDDYAEQVYSTVQASTLPDAPAPGSSLNDAEDKGQ